MKILTILALLLIVSACTYGHRDAPLNWSPGPSPAFEPKGSPGGTNLDGGILGQDKETDDA